MTAGKKVLWIVLSFAAVGAAWAVFQFPPDQTPFYPRCTLYTLTGWQCPGCGTLRAVHHLLHGHWAAAWQLNPLFVTGLPVALALAVVDAHCRCRRQPGVAQQIRPAWWWVLAIVAMVFGVVRNLWANG